MLTRYISVFLLPRNNQFHIGVLATDSSQKNVQWRWQDEALGLTAANEDVESGSADTDLLEWLIPWPLIPSELGCGELDCNHNGILDYEKENQCK